MTSSKNRVASVSPNTETSNEAIPDIKQNRDQNIELNKISLDSKKSKLGIDSKLFYFKYPFILLT